MTNEYGGAFTYGSPIPEAHTENWAAIQNCRRSYHELRAASTRDGRSKRAGDYYAEGRKLNPRIRYPDDTAMVFAIRRRKAEFIGWIQNAVRRGF